MIRFLRIEALCRCGIGDDGIIEVTECYPRNGSLRLPEQHPNCDSTSLITETSLTHQLGVIHLLHTERRGDSGGGGQGEEVHMYDVIFVSSRWSQRSINPVRSV